MSGVIGDIQAICEVCIGACAQTYTTAIKAQHTHIIIEKTDKLIAGNT